MILTARKASGAQGLDQAVEKLNKLPNISGSAIGIAANVSQVEEVERLVREVQRITGDGKLDIFVANAGATWGGPFEPTPDWSSIKILDLNVRAVFNMAQK